MRDTIRQMAARLSELGYVVLAPDFYYRSGSYPAPDFSSPSARDETMGRIMTLMSGYTTDLILRDARTFVDFLEAVPETAPGGIGTTGYCMGGRMSLLVAANLGDRIAAAASFHGGNIANPDDPDSPHHKASDIKAAVYAAGAIEDPYFTLEQRDLLEQSLREAGVTFTIETYHAHHGFAVPDNQSYDDAAAERHWLATEQFFGSALT
jgi:carboxymethylenebutenolidase